MATDTPGRSLDHPAGPERAHGPRRKRQRVHCPDRARAGSQRPDERVPQSSL